MLCFVEHCKRDKIMKFIDLPVGSRFKYGSELFIKAKQNLARNLDGLENVFPSEAEVELIREGSRSQGADDCGDRAELQ